MGEAYIVRSSDPGVEPSKFGGVREDQARLLAAIKATREPSNAEGCADGLMGLSSVRVSPRLARMNAGVYAAFT